MGGGQGRFFDKRAAGVKLQIKPLNLLRMCVSLVGRHFLSFDFGGAVAIVGMAAMVLTAAFQQTVLLYKKEALT